MFSRHGPILLASLEPNRFNRKHQAPSVGSQLVRTETLVPRRRHVESQGAGPHSAHPGPEGPGEERHEQGCGGDRVDPDRAGRAHRSRENLSFALTTVRHPTGGSMSNPKDQARSQLTPEQKAMVKNATGKDAEAVEL